MRASLISHFDLANISTCAASGNPITTIHFLGGVDATVCLADEQVTEHCKVLDTDAFYIVKGTDFLRCNCQVKLLSLQHFMPFTATLAVAFSLSLWSCQDQKNLVCAT